MDCPKVSVVVCTYNQQDFVRETVESVLAQTYPNLELILTDDGSTDDTPRILTEYAQRFPDRIKLVLSDKNTGIPANINRGMAVRTGELTAWLDGDDLMLPQKIEKQVALLKERPEAIGCYHDAEVFESETGRTLGPFSQLYNGTSKLKQGTIHDWFKPRYFVLLSSFMARSAVCPVYRFDERLKYLCEFLFFAEVFRTGTVLAIDEMLIRYRRHSRNVTDNATARSLFLEYELIVYAILDARYPELHPLVKKLRTSCLLTEAVKCYRMGNRKRFQTIVRNVINDGSLFKGLGILVGVPLFGRYMTSLTGGQPYNRPNWVKRLSQRILG